MSDYEFNLADILSDYDRYPIVNPFENIIDGVWEINADDIEYNLSDKYNRPTTTFFVDPAQTKIEYIYEDNYNYSVLSDMPLLKIKEDWATSEALMSVKPEKYISNSTDGRLNFLLEFIREYDFSKLEKSIAFYRKPYDELMDYRDMLIKAGGEGYENTLSDELSSASHAISLFTLGVIEEISDELVKAFFNYSNSKIKDLSVIDGVRCYLWNGLNSQRPFGYGFLQKTIEKRLGLNDVVNWHMVGMNNSLI